MSFCSWFALDWTPLSMEFLVGVAPLPSAWKWIPNLAVFRNLVMPSPTLFPTFEVAGHVVVILDDLLKSLFTHRLVEFLLRGTSWPLPSRDYLFVHRPLFPCCVYPSLLFGGRASSWLCRRFVCKESLGSLFGRCFQGISLLHHGMSQFLTVARRIDFHLFFVKNVLKRFQRVGDFLSCTQSRMTLLVLSARTRPQGRTPQRHWKSQKEREEAKQKRHLRNEKPEADVSWVQDERERVSSCLSKSTAREGQKEQRNVRTAKNLITQCLWRKIPRRPSGYSYVQHGTRSEKSAVRNQEDGINQGEGRENTTQGEVGEPEKTV